MAGAPADILERVREIDSQDQELAARLGAISALLQRVDAIRDRARSTHGSLDALPAERARLDALLQSAFAREDDARRDLSEAERHVEEAGRGRRSSESAREAAERELRRAETTMTDATAGRTRIEHMLATLVEDEAALRAESERLVAEAAACGAEVAALPRISDSGASRPGLSLDEIDDWGARAHAAIFVVRGGLEIERERLVDEANVIAAANLGEQGGAASVSLVRRRLEEALGEGESL